MKRILAISDIHGELAKMEEVLKKAAYNPDSDQLILLGDYVDRGPDSRGVIAKVRSLVQDGAIALKGNHDEMMSKALFIANDFWIGRWKRNGYQATVDCYQFELPMLDLEKEATEEVPYPPLPDRNDLSTARTFELSDQLREDAEFLDSLPLFHEMESYIFVHAGIHPTNSLADTLEDEMLWIRGEFHQGYQGEKTVIFGHTSTYTMHQDGSYKVYFGENNIIGIDGGAVYGGLLHCLELPSKKVYSV
ncbi:metallophosphoesterase family protein [Brevibacillus daliensis]|uniref:metallophosphoesterase family protein n=1 Tax=Brevibacillus daliensis TaxID=2892995 RepID=UPI001E3B08E2|nr:metallophosphoesterase family protein [Brevibacillus daliensis]